MFFSCSSAFCLLTFNFASAHEVYVLSPETIAQAMTMPPLQVFDIIYNNTGRFFFWGFIVIWAIFTVLSISVSKGVERFLDPKLSRLKPYAPLVARTALGLGLISSALHGALFGPELPLAFVPFSETILSVALALIGLSLLLDRGTVYAILAFFLLYLTAFALKGPYMLMYTEYLGLASLSLAASRGRVPYVQSVVSWIRVHAYMIFRVTFGFALIAASTYAKFIHAELALQTVIQYRLTDYFPFSPEFIVLGAFAIELLAGLFIALGIEVRFASLFLLFWLTLSQLYFREAVWPHIVLFGSAAALFMHGYDKYTLQWGLMKMRNPHAREPVL